MSGRSTPEIIASTTMAMNALAIEVPEAVHADIMGRWLEATDRLAELEATVLRVIDEREVYRNAQISTENELHRLHALLPHCPHCGGKGKRPGMVMLNERHGAGWGEVPCTVCDATGRVKFDQLVALWNDWHDLALSLTNVTEQHPRSVKP